MQRRSFHQLPLIASTFTFVLPPLQASRLATLPKKGVLVRAGHDRTNQPFRFLDADFFVKVSGKDTGGRYVVFDTVRHQKVGPMLHLHTDCDEWFFVIDGEFKFQVSDKVLRLNAGDSLWVPQGIPHAFVKTSEGTAHLTIMHQPAGTMEEYLRAFGASPDKSINSPRALAEKHGTKVISPPLNSN